VEGGRELHTGFWLGKIYRKGVKSVIWPKTGRTLVKAVMNLRAPQNPGKFLNWKTILDPKSEPHESRFSSSWMLRCVVG